MNETKLAPRGLRLEWCGHWMCTGTRWTPHSERLVSSECPWMPVDKNDGPRQQRCNFRTDLFDTLVRKMQRICPKHVCQHQLLQVVKTFLSNHIGVKHSSHVWFVASRWNFEPPTLALSLFLPIRFCRADSIHDFLLGVGSFEIAHTLVRRRFLLFLSPYKFR